MPARCDCDKTHVRRRVVLTGDPGAGKTAVLELIRQHFCKHVKVLLNPPAFYLVAGSLAVIRHTSGSLHNAQSSTFSVSSKRLLMPTRQRLVQSMEARTGAAMETCGPQLEQRLMSRSSGTMRSSTCGRHGSIPVTTIEIHCELNPQKTL